VRKIQTEEETRHSQAYKLKTSTKAGQPHSLGPNVARLLLNRWCSNVLRSKVEPMKEVAQMIRNHLEGILAWVSSRQTNGFLEVINGLFQAAKRKARGYGRFRTIRMVLFMIAGKLDFYRINPYITA